MRQDPFTDVLAFLADTGFPKPVFWLLLLGGAAVAVIAWQIDPAQRSIRHIGICLLRIIVGTMWWQQSLWKVPPHYDWGLIHWMQEMVEHASTQLQSVLVRDLVLQHRDIWPVSIRDRGGDRCFADTRISYAPRRAPRRANGNQSLAGALQCAD